MQRRSLVRTTIFAALITLVPPGTAAVATAATDCLAAPNQAAEGGQHWYFHTDRATSKKCWYLRERQIASTAATSAATTGAVDGTAAERGARSVAGTGAGPAQTDGSQAPAAGARTAQSDTGERARKALFRDFLRWYKAHGAAR